MNACPTCGKAYGKRKRCYVCTSKPRTGSQQVCRQCGKEFYAAAWQLRDTERKQGTYCSRACLYDAQRGQEKTTSTRYLRKDGYVSVKVGIRKYRLEHQIVAEEMLGRPLEDGEHVHHINGVKTDNRPENLVVFTNSEHQQEHARLQPRSQRVSLTCKLCGSTYERKPSRVAESNYCSAACRLEVQHEAARQYHARKRAEEERI